MRVVSNAGRDSHGPVLSGVRVTRVVQAPGEYVITFPRAYHGGFSNGFCIGEAVNFSIGDWFPFGLDAAQRYRRLSRLPILAHDELLCLEGLAIHGKALLMHSTSVHICVAFRVNDMCIADHNGKLLSFCMRRTAADALQYFADRLVSVLQWGYILAHACNSQRILAIIMFIGQMSQALSCAFYLLCIWHC